MMLFLIGHKTTNDILLHHVQIQCKTSLITQTKQIKKTSERRFMVFNTTFNNIVTTMSSNAYVEIIKFFFYQVLWHNIRYQNVDMKINLKFDELTNTCLVKHIKCYLFPLISPSDIVSINKPTLILKNISLCDIKHIMTLPIKTITSVFKISTNIITSIAARSIRLGVIPVIMFVSTFKTDIILYIIEKIKIFS